MRLTFLSIFLLSSITLFGQSPLSKEKKSRSVIHTEIEAAKSAVSNSFQSMLTYSMEEDWELTKVQRDELDGSGNVIIQEKVEKEEDEFLNQRRYESTYNNENQLLSTHAFNWDTTVNDWVSYYKFDNTYENGNFTGYIEYLWDTTLNDWKLNYKEEAVYNGSLVDTINMSYYYDSSWILIYRDIHSYDHNGNLTVYFTEVIQGDTVSGIDWYEAATYVDGMKDTVSLYHTYNGPLEMYYFYDYDYEADLEVKMTAHGIRNGGWNKMWKYEKIYDGDLITQYTSGNYMSGSYANDGRITYAYNDQNELIERVYFSYVIEFEETRKEVFLKEWYDLDNMIKENVALPKFDLYPSISSSVVNTTLNPSESYVIYNHIGKVVAKGNENLIKVDYLPTGVYYVFAEGYSVQQFVRQ